MRQSDIAERLSRIEDALAQIALALARTVPPADVRESMDQATEHIDAVATAAPPRDAQIAEIIAWMHARMSSSELQAQFDDQYYTSKQLISIMQGTRTDLVEMRGDIRRLAALLEQSLRGRVEDEERQSAWRAGDGERRRAEDRRKVSGF
jgi:hypothetical protein